MHLLTYNIARLQPFKNLEALQELLMAQNADILILTESDTRLTLNGYVVKHTNFKKFIELKNSKGAYKPTERIVSIFTKHEFVEEVPTFNNKITIAWKIKLDAIEVIVYGLVLGLTGKGDMHVNEHLAGMLFDWNTLASCNQLIIAGDFNTSFADNYYVTSDIRNKLQASFLKNKLVALTGGIPNCIDHIILSQALVVTDNAKICRNITVNNFGVEKKLSDHFGVSVQVK